MKSFVFMCWMLIHSASAASAALWYVDNAATGSRNGTSWANAWTNPSSVTGIAAGDTVYISGGTVSKTYYPWDGTYNSWLPRYSGGSGTAGNLITYQVGQDAGHNGEVIIDCRATNAWMSLDQVRFLKISGNYNGLTNLIVTNSNQALIVGDYGSDITYEYCKFYNAIRFNGSTNIVIQRCLIRPPAEVSSAVIWGVHPTAGTTVFQNTHTNNILRENTWQLPCSSNTPAWGTDGISGGESTLCYSNVFSVYYVTNDVEWQHCDAWQNLGGSNCRIWANRFDGISNYAIFWESLGSFSNIWIYNNYFLNTDSFYHANQLTLAIVVAERTPGSTNFNLLVANNTIVDYFGRSGIGLGDDPSESSTWANCLVANNLMYNSGKNGSYDSMSLYLGSGGTNGWSLLFNKAIAGGRGTNTIVPSQLAAAGGDNGIAFTSYSELSPSNDLDLLSSDTAAKDAGIDLTAYFTTDFKGRPRVAPFDLGAYEYIAPASTYRGFSIEGGVKLIGAGSIRQ